MNAPARVAGFLVTVAATLLCAACGFHLAGSRPLPEDLKSVYIDVVNPYRVSEPPLEIFLRAILQRRGAQIADSAAQARTVITLSELRETRNVLSIGLDGKALEFQLITRVRYRVTRGGQALLAPDMLEVTHDYSFNAQEVLAKEAEEQRLREYMQNDLAEMLALRLEVELGRTVAAIP
jgi:LPS-assembly lipoprotein